MTYCQWVEAMLNETIAIIKYDDGSKNWCEHYEKMTALLEEYSEYRVRYVNSNPEADHL